MVRFSCFHTHGPYNKHKKTVPPSMEAMQKELQDGTKSQSLTKSNSSFLKNQGDHQNNDSAKPGSGLASVEHVWKSENIKSKFNVETDIQVDQTGEMKKSLSLDSGLYCTAMASLHKVTEDENDPLVTSDGSNKQNGLVVPGGCNFKDLEANPADQSMNAPISDSFTLSPSHANNESIFSIGDPPQLVKDTHETSDTLLSDEYAEIPHHVPLDLVKSLSLPTFTCSTPTSGKCLYKHLTQKSRSSEDVLVLEIKRKDMSLPAFNNGVMLEQARHGNIGENDKNHCDSSFHDGCDSYNHSCLAQDWIIPIMDDVNTEVANFQSESSVQCWEELPGQDFKAKRIKDWVDDLQPCGQLEEQIELFDSINKMGKDVSTSVSTASKVDDKLTPGMEVARRYISSLSASATTAQLANHGLVVFPFLSAFVSLKVLNLSGNSIARITAGALPRGLHMLNLSKNKISTIEGLRELTRLRVLDLSYNRIVRIGHGLASCSSLKELYLAGNKISEVEGLHRLLKLNVLDLRFNKISTAKCLGQLAANYNSLQAISLEGNPAQKNVGDEQMKKYLQGLLPHLAFFNRQPIKASSLKDAADRSVRLGISSHQFDRSLRSDQKSTRKGSYGVVIQKPSSSSTHGRRSQAVVSPKRSKSKHGLLPPAGTKASTHGRQDCSEVGNKLMNFRPDLFIRRSHSEGNLGAL